MNRIYQGRVSKVFDDQKQELNLNVLWQHHELFQDAVNYYAFALAVMANGMVEKDENGKERLTSMARFAEQVLGNGKPRTADDCVEGRWEDFSHKGKKRAGLKHSLARTLGLDSQTITKEGCINRIFGHALEKFPRMSDGRLHDVFRGVISELFPAKKRGNPQQLANEDPGWLCWKGKGGEPPADKTFRKQRGASDFMEKLFQANTTQLKELSQLSIQESCLSGVEENNDAGGNPEEGENIGNPDEGGAEATADEDAGYLVGLDAVEQLDKCAQTARTFLTSDQTFRLLFDRCGGKPFNIQNELKRLDEFVATKRHEEQKRQENLSSPSNFRFQNWKRSGPGKDNIRVELFVLFHCDCGSEFTATLLKTRLIQKKLYQSWLHSNDKRRYIELVDRFQLCGSEDWQEPEKKITVARKAAAKPDYKSVVSSLQKTDFIPRLKKEMGYIFPSFTAIRGFAVQKGDSKQANGACQAGYFAWTKFDNAAYEEAIKSPNQIQKKEKERADEAKTLEELKKLYEGKGREKGKSEDGEEEDFIPGGFSDSGDSRFAAMERIHKSLAVADGADPDKLYRYGISQAALRGYEDLRDAWNKKVAPGEKFSEAKAKELKTCVADYQRQHRDDMGDSRLFEELTKENNWCVWQAAKPEEETERVAKRYSTNIVRDYLRYCDVLEDLEKKKRPVQYTPADARDSRRLFDFKGASQGGFEHLSSQDVGLSFTTQIAIKGSDGLYHPTPVHIYYTAPRLLRDEARVLSENEDLQSANWAQPFMRALGIPEDNRHDFKKHAVSLMPAWKPENQFKSEPDRLLLNFVLAPKEDNFIAYLRKQMGREAWPWMMQFNWNGDGHDSTLRWPHEDWSKVKNKKEFPGFWFTNPNLESFRLLSVDLGQKQAGAYSIIEVSCRLTDEERKHARFLGRTEDESEQRDWYARVITTGLLKLPGENATVYRPDYKDGIPVPGSKHFQKELSGSAGRLAAQLETDQTLKLLAEMQQLKLLDDEPDTAKAECGRLTFPEQNTKLLIALRRAQSFAGKLHRWCWFLDPQDDVERKDQAARRRTAIKEIAEADEHEWLDKDALAKAKARHAQLDDAKDEPELHPEIVRALKSELEKLVEKLPRWLEAIANRTYRSRRGRLIWVKHPEKVDCHLLDFSLLSKEERKQLSEEEKRLAGQRGLSIERIEQLEELRKRCQSLNQMLRRKIGCKPPLSRDDSIPDPCPTILAKLDDIKEERRNQTAHMILTQALGLTLAEPIESKNDAERELQEAKDTHGEYVKADDKGRAVSPENGNQWRGIVDFIVIEDLSRYRTSQGRAPRENSRLMKWCHRAIRDKLKDANGSGMCEVFGIPLVETPAAYSSRFCSRTGVAGFRATEISGDPLEESKWRWRIRKPEEGKTESKEQMKRREQWELLFQQIKAANKNRDGKNEGQLRRTLLAPDAGGGIFIPISKLNSEYKRQTKNEPIIQFELVALAENQFKQPRLIHADINAAVNLGLRAIADPRLWSVHSRLRSEREFGAPQTTKKVRKKKADAEATQALAGKVNPDKFWVSEKEKRKYGQQNNGQRIEIKLLDADKANLSASDSRHPNFFDDVADLRTWIHGGAAILQGLPENYPLPKHLVSGKALWGYVKDQAWKRCMAINAARLRAWGLERPKEWEA